MNTKQNEQKSLAMTLQQPEIKKRFYDMLGKKAAGFMSSIISAVNQNSALKEAEPISVISAAAIAASMDLPINPNLGFAYIIPYKSNGLSIAQFQMGYKGFVQLGIRTAEYSTIHASEVYQDEIVRWDPIRGILDLAPIEAWKQRYTGKGTIAGYAAYFKLKSGFEKWLYMTVGQIDTHARRYSKSYNNPDGRWKQDPDSMSKKTVLKMLLSKYGILSIDMQRAIESDQATVKADGTYEYVDNPTADIPETQDSKANTTAPKSTKETKKDKNETKEKNVDKEPLSVEEALSVPVNMVIPSIVGRLTNIAIKPAKIAIHIYTIENNGVSIEITKFGPKLNFVLDDYLECVEVKVQEYKNNRQYIATDIKIAELTGN